MKLAIASLAAAVFALLSGCAAIQATPPSAVHQPMSVRPEAMATALPANGAIYQTVQARPLFEDRRARRIGDTITINLVERNTAQKSANANATRNGNMTAGIGPISRLPLSGLNGLELEAEAESDFNGKGAAAANNVFTGTITVTVIEVMPNGNLLVSGEKQVSIGAGTEYIRLSGIVNPYFISTANSISSANVADARIEYKESGVISEAQVMGWLARFFLSVLPF